MRWAVAEDLTIEFRNSPVKRRPHEHGLSPMPKHCHMTARIFLHIIRKVVEYALNQGRIGKKRLFCHVAIGAFAVALQSRFDHNFNACGHWISVFVNIFHSV